ncbi:MAG: hypothetical protein K5650_00605, partial [Bacteroidales bacterium]|nr:hypothetical protein [Bacteroidales bacterium]
MFFLPNAKKIVIMQPKTNTKSKIMKTCKNKSFKACVVALLLLSAVSVNAIAYSQPVDTVPVHRTGYFGTTTGDTICTTWSEFSWNPMQASLLHGFSNRFYSQEPVTIYGVAAI